MRTVIITVVACLVLWTAGCGGGGEVPFGGVTRPVIDRLKIGMTLERVNAIIGHAGELAGKTIIDGEVCRSYRWPGARGRVGRPRIFVGHFRDGRLVVKSGLLLIVAGSFELPRYYQP